MKKTLHKALAITLACAGTTLFSVGSVYAANTVITEGPWVYSDADGANVARYTKGTITVLEVNDAGRNATPVTVTAYQIVKGSYENGRFVEYVLCDTTNAPLANPAAPTANEITAIANNIGSGTTTLNGIRMTRDDSDPSHIKYTAEVEAGLYIVLATGADAAVYNPAIVAVNLRNEKLPDGGTVGIDGTVDMTSYFEITSKAYLKSSKSGFNKDIVNGSVVDPVTETVNTEGDTAAFGDTVSFVLNQMTIPSYSADYPAGTLIYKIEDSLAAGSFMGISNLKVKVGGVEVAPSTTEPAATNYTLTYQKNGTATQNAAEADSFEISFSDTFIRANAEKSVEITYSSTLSNTAGLNYSENKNTAALSYSCDPTAAANCKVQKDSTYHYTFGIDADIDAQDGEHNKVTYELNKVTKAGETYEENSGTMRSPKRLPGATFALYRDAACTQAVQINGTAAQAVSDTDGHISFRGLDTGVYYLKETEAPDDYTLNETVYQITIDAALDEEGVLQSYSITTKAKNADTGAYTETVGTAVYTNEAYTVDDNGNVSVTTRTDAVTPAEIVNTDLARLPSTGGVGTIIITVTAGVGMAGFLTLFIVNRRKRKKEKE